MEGQQFESSLIKNLPKSGVFSVPTPIEEMNPVICWIRSLDLEKKEN